jgi:hypothetical protein
VLMYVKTMRNWTYDSRTAEVGIEIEIEIDMSSIEKRFGQEGRLDRR